MAVRAITMVKTMVLEGFHFCHGFTDLVSRGMVLGDIFESFCDLGDIFCAFLGYWEQS